MINRSKLKLLKSLLDIYFNITDGSDINNLDIPSFAPFSADIDTSSPIMNVNAAKRIFTKTKNLLNTNNVWTLTKNNKGDGKLFSAEIASDANIKDYKVKYSRVNLQNAKLNEYDIVFFVDAIFILNPNSIINIKEESDDVNDVSVLSGQRSNYDGLSQLSYPGSGGFLENSGGLGGAVQLPGQF